METRDPAFPQIHPLCTPTRKLGGDVADFTYRQAWIDGNHAYKITGRRGTARWLNVTVQGPRPEKIPGTDWPSLHEPFGDIPETNIFGHQLTTDEDGNFELYVGGAGRAENWLPTTPGSRKLFIREAFDAWFETPTTLSIERIGMDGPRPIPNSNAMVEAMDWAGDFLTGAMRDWPEHSWRHSGGVCDPAFTNRFPPDKFADADSDAKRGRIAAHMIWAAEGRRGADRGDGQPRRFLDLRHGRRLRRKHGLPVPRGELHPGPHRRGQRQRGALRDRPRRPRCAQLA